MLALRLATACMHPTKYSKWHLNGPKPDSNTRSGRPLRPCGSGHLVTNFQAVIKSAASAASRETKNQGPRSREPADDGSASGRRGSAGLPWIMVPDFELPGGCASSRLDHVSKFYGIRGGCASSRLIHGFSDCEKI